MHLKEIYIRVILIFLFNTIANVMIKKGALQKKDIIINRYTSCGYILFLLVMLISLNLITMIELKYYSLVLSINYFMTYIAGIIVFKEKTNTWGITGIVIVCFGIIIFNF